MASNRSERSGRSRLGRFIFFVFVGWTVMVIACYVWVRYDSHEATIYLALSDARMNFAKDVAFRRWATHHGGVYVPVEPDTPPNPHLSFIPERDVVTPSGRVLTLMNPAYMLRQYYEHYSEGTGAKGHITSLNPIRPENGPDAWERQALLLFEKGQQEVSEIQAIDGQPYMRYMKPLRAEKGCLRCHAHQGYKVGDIRGGIAVAVPTTAYAVQEERRNKLSFFLFACIWLLGDGGLFAAYRLLRRALDEQQRSEQEIRALNDNLEQRVLERTQALDEAVKGLESAKRLAEAASRAKTEFLSSMSHDIRTPMNTILGMSELLAEGSVSAEQKEYLEASRRAGETLLALINDILDLSKIEAGQLIIEIAPFQLLPLLESVVQILGVQVKEKDLQLSYAIGEGVPDTIIGDQDRLRQILLNLIGNAVKFTDQGKVTLRVDIGPGSDLLFTVSDTGIGIPQERIEYIFEPFIQGDRATRGRYGGTGLGLAICKRLLQNMGGRIWVESEVGKGSVFQFTLPWSAQEVNVVGENQASRTSLHSAEWSNVKRNISILIADDSADNRLLIRAFLKDKAVELSEAEDGEEAVFRFKQGKFDIIFMDLQMPIIDGYEAIRQIRAYEKEAGKVRTPIIALTAHAMKEQRTACLEAGADFHLTKPLKRQRLLDIILEYVNPSADV